MLNTTYADIFAQFKRDIGLAPDFGENADLAAKFNGWFNDRLREIWRAARWPSCTESDGLIVCSNGDAVIPAKIDDGDKIELFSENPKKTFAPKRADYVLNDGWLWVGEKKVSRLYAPDECYITDATQDGECFMRSDGNVYRYSLLGTNWQLSGKLLSTINGGEMQRGDTLMVKVETGSTYHIYYYIYVGESPAIIDENFNLDNYGNDFLSLVYPPFLPCVWLTYKRAAPYYGTDGVEQISNTNLPVPLFMKRYIQLAVHSDYLRSVNRHEEASAVFANAESIKEEEIYKYESTRPQEY